MVESKKLFCILYSFISLVLIFFIYQAKSFDEERFNIGENNDFLTSWKMSIEGKDIEKVIDLPYYTDENTVENIISIKNIIPDKRISSPHIRVKSLHQSFEVYLENELIYKFDSIRKINNGKTGGKTWRIIKLPEDCFGKEIRIDFKSSYKRGSGSLDSIKIGTKDQLISEVFFQGIFGNVVVVEIIILLFLIIFISYIEIKIKKRGYKSNNIYIVILALCVLVWILLDTQLYSFICNNYALAYYIKFVALFLFPIFGIKYIMLRFDLEDKRLINILLKIHIYLLIILIIGQITGLIPFTQGQTLFLFIFIITFFILNIYIAYQAIYDKKLRKILYILFIVFISLFLECFLYDFKENSLTLRSLELQIIIIGVITCANIYDRFLKLNEEKQKGIYLELQLKNQIQHYIAIEENNMRLKRYRHDMANHWILINRLIKDKKIEESEIYSSKMAKELSFQEDWIIDTGNPVLDAILSEKIQKARKLNIDISHKIFISKGIKIDPIDCCVIFGNALDNAIEACIKLNDSRYININLNSQNNMIICKVRNSIKVNSILTNYQTTKKDKSEHGLGLKNIEKAVRNYNGYMKIENNNQFFELSFVLYDV